MTRSLLLLLAFLLQISAAELPVRRVVLYKHGVGYFERSGELRPGEAARLDFKASEMDDMLKSLTISDTTGNKISGVRYDSSEPLSRKLSEFPFNIGDHKPLSVFLDSLKGARVELRSVPRPSRERSSARVFPPPQRHSRNASRLPCSSTQARCGRWIYPVRANSASRMPNCSSNFGSTSRPSQARAPGKSAVSISILPTLRCAS